MNPGLPLVHDPFWYKALKIQLFSQVTVWKTINWWILCHFYNQCFKISGSSNYILVWICNSLRWIQDNCTLLTLNTSSTPKKAYLYITYNPLLANDMYKWKARSQDKIWIWICKVNLCKKIHISFVSCYN